MGKRPRPNCWRRRRGLVGECYSQPPEDRVGMLLSAWSVKVQAEAVERRDGTESIARPKCALLLD